MNAALKKFLTENGAKGGSSRSPAKVAAAKINAEKARKGLASRSKFVARKEAEGTLKRVGDGINATDPLHDAPADSTIVYEKKEKWKPEADSLD